MAFDVRAAGHSEGTGSSVTLDAPVGTLSTDALFVVILHDSGISFVTDTGIPSGGWSILSSAFTGDSTLRLVKFGGAPLTGPWTFTFTGSTKYVAAVIAIARDAAVGSTVPVPDASSATTQAAGTGSAVCPTISPGTAGDLLVNVAGWGRGTTFTPPGGQTQRVDAQTGAGSTDKTLYVGSELLVSAGATGTRAVTNDNPGGLVADEYVVASIAFKSTPPPSTWVGDFETGDRSQYSDLSIAASDRIEIRTDSPRQGTYYARFTAQDGDVYPLTATENPRAQANGPAVIFPGFERWISWATRFPSSFPTIPAGDWFVFFQYHGTPYPGSPSLGWDVEGDDLVLKRNAQYGYDTIWRAPMVKGVWLDFAARIRFEQDTTGWVEFYYRGIQQRFYDGSRRLGMQTMYSSQNGGIELVPTLYRKHGSIVSAVTLDHDAVRMDATPPALAGAATVSRPVTVGTAIGGGTFKARLGR